MERPASPRAPLGLRLGLGLGLRLGLGLGVGLGLGLGPAAAAEPPAPANLLLVTLDTLRADHLGFLGYPRPTSPNLDRLAERATVFTDVTCSMPTTLPSHLSILTGLTPRQHGVSRNGLVPRDGLDTLLRRCQAHGRRTAAVMGSGVLGQRYISGLGLDDLFVDTSKESWEVPASTVTDRALGWLASHHDQPFALWVHYFDPHEPYAPPAALAARFRSTDSDLPDVLDTDYLIGLGPEAAARLSAADRRHIVDLYDAEVAYLDHHLGRLLRAVGERALADNTVVVVIADHGQAHGEQSFWGHGERLLEPVIKIPLMIHLPGQSRGRRVAAAVESLDLFPTLVDVLGLGAAEGLPGRSLRPALDGRPITGAAQRVVVRRSYGRSPERQAVAVHTGHSKVSWYRERNRNIRWLGHQDELGLDAPTPLTEDSRWQTVLTAAMADHGVTADGDEPPLPADEAAMLEALGYLDPDPQPQEAP